MVREIRYTPNKDESRAGYFEKRPFLDRINPFTPFHSKRFVPSPEAKEILDNFRKETGKTANVFPLPHEREDLGPIHENTLGLYVGGDYRGGALDPFSRNVYLSDNLFHKPGLFTLAHELGHAADKSMWKKPIERFAGGLHNLTGNKFRGKPDPIKTGLFDKSPLGQTYDRWADPTYELYKDELEAEAYGKKAFQKIGLETEVPNDLFSYPASYINRLNEEFEAAPLRSPPSSQFKKYDLETGANYDYSQMDKDALNQHLFSLAGDYDYQKSKQSLINRALEFSDTIGINKSNHPVFRNWEVKDKEPW